MPKPQSPDENDSRHGWLDPNSSSLPREQPAQPKAVK